MRASARQHAPLAPHQPSDVAHALLLCKCSEMLVERVRVVVHTSTFVLQKSCITILLEMFVNTDLKCFLNKDFLKKD